MKELIDKAAVVAEIERLDDYWHLSKSPCGQAFVESLLSFLNDIEVKEVGLKEELKTLDNLLYDLDGVAVIGTSSFLTVEDVKDIAKYFFELGLKAKKEE